MLKEKIKIQLILSAVMICFVFQTKAQNDSTLFSEKNIEESTTPYIPSPQVVIIEQVANPKRLWLVSGVHAVGYAGSFIALYKTWYSGYNKTKLHAFDDLPEWKQMDKAGHLWTSYHIARYSTEQFKWTNLPRKKAVLIGSGFSLLYTTTLEVFDGYSTGWGFSFSDIGANILGTSLYTFQALHGRKQHVKLKFSYHDSPYAAYRPSLLGSNFGERMLKDYNGQTYWLSFSPASFHRDGGFPRWLCVSLGYGADGMTGGSANPTVNEAGTSIPSFNRTREFYLSVDIDFESIPTKSKFLKGFFKVINCIKIPAPALLLNSEGKFTGKAFYF